MNNVESKCYHSTYIHYHEKLLEMRIFFLFLKSFWPSDLKGGHCESAFSRLFTFLFLGHSAVALSSLTFLLIFSDWGAVN